jgi:hypothetical protein
MSSEGDFSIGMQNSPSQINGSIVLIFTVLTLNRFGMIRYNFLTSHLFIIIIFLIMVIYTINILNKIN